MHHRTSWLGAIWEEGLRFIRHLEARLQATRLAAQHELVFAKTRDMPLHLLAEMAAAKAAAKAGIGSPWLVRLFALHSGIQEPREGPGS